MPDNLNRVTIAYVISRLHHLTSQIGVCLQSLTSEQVWQRPGPGQNAIGNLILHLTGNLRERVQHGIAARPNVRRRHEEFEATGGPDGPALLQGLQETLEEATGILLALSEADLGSRSVLRPEEHSKMEAILQVLSHFSQHNGQIIYATKVMVGPDIQLPRAPAPSHL